MIRLNSNIPYSRLGKYRASFNIRALVKVLVVIGIIVAAHSFLVKPIQRYLRDGRPCFKHSVNIEQSIEFFPDLSEAAKQPTPGKTIFFLETSCSGDGFARLNARYVGSYNGYCEWSGVFVLIQLNTFVHKDVRQPSRQPLQTIWRMQLLLHIFFNIYQLCWHNFS